MTLLRLQLRPHVQGARVGGQRLERVVSRARRGRRRDGRRRQHVSLEARHAAVQRDVAQPGVAAQQRDPRVERRAQRGRRRYGDEAGLASGRSGEEEEGGHEHVAQTTSPRIYSRGSVASAARAEALDALPVAHPAEDAVNDVSSGPANSGALGDAQHARFRARFEAGFRVDLTADERLFKQMNTFPMNSHHHRQQQMWRASMAMWRCR
ncbi:MAG: hypothetical protein DI536_13275 [Archangium gephyra]|uniref:Uncharacterized protein n=1 Tax=Archangium gephyra TaxID=48 RepID=A0A2W5TEQ7_9BACT|nr:MAG: hypothetical protein DI536_13275 [Archangium gephyra]